MRGKRTTPNWRWVVRWKTSVNIVLFLQTAQVLLGKSQQDECLCWAWQWWQHLAIKTDETLQQANHTENEIDISITIPECAASKVAKEHEVFLLECATHLKMARVQRCLYQAKVEQDKTYTFIIDMVRIWSFRYTIPSSPVSPIIIVLWACKPWCCRSHSLIQWRRC